MGNYKVVNKYVDQESSHNQIIKLKQDLPLLKAIHGKSILT